MKINQFISKFKLFWKIFISSSKVWKLPQKSDILIYDACGKEVLMPYLKNYSVSILSLRGEFLCLPCLILACLKLAFWKGELLNAYSEVFIKIVSPKIIITLIDNNANFYTISKKFCNIKTIFIQNGLRGWSGDIFGRLIKSQSYHVDFMIVFGDAIGRHYRKYISGKSISIGSLKNNAFNGSVISGNYVLFISQWHKKPNNDKPFYFEANGKVVKWENFFEAENKVLQFLDEWCHKNNLELKICGRETNDVNEKIFYKNLISKCKLNYVSRSGIFSSYKLINNSKIVVTIDSTLGYESLARGKRTAFFSCRKVGISKQQRTTFGWPLDLPDNGFFWTNNMDSRKFQSIMNFLNALKEKDWKKVSYKYTAEIMQFDRGNSKLISLLNILLPKYKAKTYVN
jgi:hypothetical protein